MPSSIQHYTQLAEQTTKQITGSYQDWTAFLTTAARLYKYPYHEQLMIYAQRPDATACADFDLWNKTLRRYVRRGSKGIALIDDTGDTPKLRYVFDVSDTGGRENSRRPFLWEYRPEHTGAVVDALENQFIINGDNGIDQQLEEIAAQLAYDYWQEHKCDLIDIVDDSFLEDYDELNIGAQFRAAATVSITYSLMSRCGLAPEEYFEHEDFLSIFDFNTPATMTFLGTAVSDASENVLRHIEVAIKNYERSKAHEQSDIHPERGLSDSRPDSSGDQQPGLWKIRQDEEIIPERASDSNVQSPVVVGQADGASERDRPDSAEPLGADDAPNDGGTERDREPESQRPDEMGGHDEQPESAGRGNDSDGVNLQLSFFPTEAEQISLIDEAESLSASAFSVSPADIDAELRRGSGYEGGKLRIYAAFQTISERKELIAFLKDEYNYYGHSHTYLDGSGGFVDYTPGKGMALASGSYEDKVAYSYTKMVNRIAELIAADNYLTPEEKARYSEIERDYAGIGGVPTPHPRFGFPPPSAVSEPEPTPEVAPRTINQDDIDVAIQAWNGDINSKHTVDRHMKIHARDRNTAAFLRNEYGGDLAAFPVSADGAHNVPWTQIQKRIFQLMEADRFYSQAEQDNHDDIDPIAIREALAERGIVNGEIVDQELFDNSPFIQQVSADVARIAVEEQAAEIAPEPESISPPPIFFVDWEQARYDLDLSNYNDRDVIGYNKDGVEYALGRSGGITYTTETTMITTWGEVLGNEHIPIEIRRQIVDYHDGKLTDEQVRENYMAALGIELPPPPAQNFRITDDTLGTGTASQKYAANTAAIRTLKAIEAEGRAATPDEQEILSRYVGWGGLASCFEEGHSKHGELKNSLTDSEYEAARASTLNAHYTSPTVIKAIYEAVGNMGFQTGNILEPACGVGNFFGLLPEEMQHSKLYGTELDSITGRIAKQLYPDADIQVAGFESTDRRDFYDLAVGNVPFGQYQVNDRAYNKLGFSIHDYFFAKTLDQVRPGGVVAFITSRYTMDKKSPEVRRHLAERAELLGAIRLPNNAFKANAGTEVVSDIIFLQKRDSPIVAEPDWVHLGENADGYAINSYFIEHPEMILGQQTSESTQYGRQDFTVAPIEGADLADQLRDAVSHITGSYAEAELPDLGDGEHIDTSIPADPDVKNYSYTIVDGEVYFRENSRMVRPELNATATERVKGMVELRDCVQSLINQQLDSYVTDAEITATQNRLNRLYDNFTAKHGLINSRGNSLGQAQKNLEC